MPDPLSSEYASHTVNDVSAPSGIRSLYIPFLNHLLDGDLCKKISLNSVFFLFLVFNHDFIIYIYFTRIAASNTATDDAAN